MNRSLCDLVARDKMIQFRLDLPDDSVKKGAEVRVRGTEVDPWGWSPDLTKGLEWTAVDTDRLELVPPGPLCHYGRWFIELAVLGSLSPGTWILASPFSAGQDHIDLLFRHLTSKSSIVTFLLDYSWTRGRLIVYRVSIESHNCALMSLFFHRHLFLTSYRAIKKWGFPFKVPSRNTSFRKQSLSMGISFCGHRGKRHDKINISWYMDRTCTWQMTWHWGSMMGVTKR